MEFDDLRSSPPRQSIEAREPNRRPSMAVLSMAPGRSITNLGSTARDHLSNERTFLAWLRTALSLIVLGLAIAKFTPSKEEVLFSAAFIILGTIVLVNAWRRYFQVARALERGEFNVSAGSIHSTVLLTCALVVLALLYLIDKTDSPGPGEQEIDRGTYVFAV